jgi:hypothetical protein
MDSAHGPLELSWHRDIFSNSHRHLNRHSPRTSFDTMMISDDVETYQNLLSLEEPGDFTATGTFKLGPLSKMILNDFKIFVHSVESAENLPLSDFVSDENIAQKFSLLSTPKRETALSPFPKFSGLTPKLIQWFSFEYDTDDISEEKTGINLTTSLKMIPNQNGQFTISGQLQYMMNYLPSGQPATQVVSRQGHYELSGTCQEN